MGFFSEGFVNHKKLSNHLENIRICIHPDICQDESEPGGACFIKIGESFFMGTIKYGGTKEPPALMQLTTVIREPLPADVIYSICLFPFAAKILGCLLRTIDTPVSSTFQIRWSWRKFIFFRFLL